MTKICLFVLFLVFTFSQAGIHSFFASRLSARNADLDELLFKEGVAITFPPSDAPEYSFPTHVVFGKSDITTWFQSYFMTNQIKGRLVNHVIPFPKQKQEIGSSPSVASGIIEYNLGKNFLISTFAENQAVQFPPSSVAAFPVIQKVLYGVPGFDIDMTEWFRSYFFQNQVNGRLNKQINFNSIFGDPKFGVAKLFKITYYTADSISYWLAPPMILEENQFVDFPTKIVSSLNTPIILEAKYGAGSKWASDATSVFTKWISKSPRNGIYRGKRPIWNDIFGDPNYGTVKQVEIYYMIPITQIDLNGVTFKTATFGENTFVNFPLKDSTANPIITKVTYGAGSQQFDVTEKFLKFFIQNAKYTGRLSGNYNWNNVFGDPLFGIYKTVTVTYSYPKTPINFGLLSNEEDVETYEFL